MSPPNMRLERTGLTTAQIHDDLAVHYGLEGYAPCQNRNGGLRPLLGRRERSE